MTDREAILALADALARLTAEVQNNVDSDNCYHQWKRLNEIGEAVEVVKRGLTGA